MEHPRARRACRRARRGTARAPRPSCTRARRAPGRGRRSARSCALAGSPPTKSTDTAALVGCDQLDRPAELLVERVDQQMEKRRLRERAARGGRRSVRGKFAHGSGGGPEISVWVPRDASMSAHGVARSDDDESPARAAEGDRPVRDRAAARRRRHGRGVPRQEARRGGHLQGPGPQAHPADARRLAAFPLDVHRGGAARHAPQPPERRPGLRVSGLRRRGPPPRHGVRRGVRPRTAHVRGEIEGRPPSPAGSARGSSPRRPRACTTRTRRRTRRGSRSRSSTAT